jgi:hypothetical protein
MIYFSSQFQRDQSIVAWTQKLGQNIMAAGVHDGGASSAHCRQEAENKTGRSQGQDNPKDLPLSELLPPGRPHLIKFPEHPKIVPPAGDQAFDTRAYGGHFIFKP